MIYRGKSDHYIQSMTRIKRFEIIIIVMEKKKKKGEWNGRELGGPDWHEAMKITVPRTRISVTLLYYIHEHHRRYGKFTMI